MAKCSFFFLTLFLESTVSFSEREMYSIFVIGTLGIFLPTIIAILFFIFYQRRLLKQHQKNKALEASYQRELLEANINTEERVRKQIAKDLHDDIGARLSTIKLYANQIQRKLEKKLFPIRLTKQTKELASETIENVRTISHNLLPPLLENFGLAEALEDFCDKLNSSDDIVVNFEHKGYQRINIESELALFRVVQELTQNTLKHAQASHINIYLYAGIQQLRLIYEDDGVGFDLSNNQTTNNQLIKKDKKGLGLKNIESRVKVLNGNMTFHSAKNEGIQMEVYLNL